MPPIPLLIMSLLYIAAGVYHFVNPALYRSIMPPWLPAHQQLVLLSGAAEIILGILLLPMATRAWAAWGVILLLIAVFPANIQMAIHYYQRGNPHLWIALLRLPLQGVLIWWAWQYTR